MQLDNGLEFYSGFEYGENPPEDVFLEKGEPFYLKHDNKPETVIICLHGYTASPYEAKPIGEKCYELGFDAVGPVVPAHAIKDREKAMNLMNKVSRNDWIKAIELEVEEARKRYKNVFIYGQSMGGVISIIMAEKGLVDALALTAPAIKLPKYSMALWLLGWLKVNAKDNSAKNRQFFNVSYDFHNVHTMKELFLMGRYARANLEKISCPVLECHSEMDEIITPKVAHMMKTRVAGPIEIQWYNDSLHTMPLHIRGEDVSSNIAKFFANLNHH